MFKPVAVITFADNLWVLARTFGAFVLGGMCPGLEQAVSVPPESVVSDGLCLNERISSIYTV